jgi:hypothetical protein
VTDAAVVVELSGIPRREEVASRYRRLNTVSGSIRRRVNAESEQTQYNHQYDGAKRDSQVDRPSGLWMCTPERHGAETLNSSKR